MKKGEARKGQGERKGNTQNKQINALFGGKQGFFLFKKRKNKKTKETKHKKQPKKTEKILKNELFSYQSNVSFFGGGCPKFPFLTTWPKKRARPKTLLQIGVSADFFENNICVTKRPFLDQKKNQIQKFQLSVFFAYFLRFQQQKAQKVVKTPIFIVF